MKYLAILATLLWLLAPQAAGAACKGDDLLVVEGARKPGLAAELHARAAKVPNAEGVFWKVEKSGVAASYLYGTMHLDGMVDTVPAHASATDARTRAPRAST